MESRVADDSGLFINHFAHQHQLKSFHIKVKNEIPCKACRENISGDVYGCIDCKFFSINPSLALVQISPNDSASLNCTSCLETISSYALAFKCQGACKFVLDVKGALETLTCLHHQGGLLRSEHPLDDHPLQLCYMKNPVRCEACEKYFKGLAYRCYTSCNCFLHRSCAELPLKMQHPNHVHPVAFHPVDIYEVSAKDNSFSCHACFKYGLDIGFHCAQCDFGLDFSCASRNPTFKHPLHKHGLSHFEEIEKCCRCKACGKSCRVDLYRCVQCDFNVHSACLPELPRKVKHKFHPHQLTLAYSFVEDDAGDYYICEFCGQTRDIELGVYYCEECPREITLAAHMECAISADTVLADKVREIVKVTKSTTAAKLDEEIATVRAQLDALNKELDVLKGLQAALVSRKKE